jgi:hypothetical protein
MIQRRDMAGLAFQALTEFGVDGDPTPDDLYRHGAIEASVVRTIHLAHAAAPQERHDLVGAEPGTGAEGQTLLKVSGLYRGQSVPGENLGVDAGQRNAGLATDATSAVESWFQIGLPSVPCGGQWRDGHRLRRSIEDEL